jgi:glutathione S-transferase
LPAEVEIAKENFNKAAAVLEEALRNKTYLCEDRFSVADIVVTYTLIWTNA